MISIASAIRRFEQSRVADMIGAICLIALIYFASVIGYAFSPNEGDEHQQLMAEGGQ